MRRGQMAAENNMISIQPFRHESFPIYALIYYLAVRVPRLGYKVTEVSGAQAISKTKNNKNQSDKKEYCSDENSALSGIE